MRKVRRSYHYKEAPNPKEDELTVTCSACKRDVPISTIADMNDRIFSNSTYICVGCAEEQFDLCGRCGRYYASQCRCFNPEAGMGNWDAKPIKETKLAIGDEKLFLGMEFEVTSSSDRDSDITNIGRKFKTIAYCKHDGSVWNGFEVVTFPISPEYLMKHLDLFEAMFNYMTQRKMKASTVLPQTNGFHIHMSKAAFSNFHLDKFIDFFYNNFRLVGYVSERAWTNIFRWSPLYTKLEELKGQKSNPDKHIAVNLKNPLTVELRFFKGCIGKRKFLKNVQFALSAYDFTKMVNQKDLTEENYLNFIRENEQNYPELVRFLRYYRGI